jgi:hypothetical protein
MLVFILYSKKYMRKMVEFFTLKKVLRMIQWLFLMMNE